MKIGQSSQKLCPAVRILDDLMSRKDKPLLYGPLIASCCRCITPKPNNSAQFQRGDIFSWSVFDFPDEKSMIDCRPLSLLSESTFSLRLGDLDSHRGSMSSGFHFQALEEMASTRNDDPNTDSNKREKPKRPLSAYNFFFQNERQAILQDIPTRTEGKPRRSHGKIGFADLARSIAAKWRNLSDQDRAVFDERAVVDKARYRKEMEEWKKSQLEAKQALSPVGFSAAEQPTESFASLFADSNFMRQHTAASNVYEPEGDERKMQAYGDIQGVSLSDLFECQFAQAVPPTTTETQEQPPNSPRIADLASQLGEESTEYFLNLFRGDNTDAK
jgi:HMG-box domain